MRASSITGCRPLALAAHLGAPRAASLIHSRVNELHRREPAFSIGDIGQNLAATARLPGKLNDPDDDVAGAGGMGDRSNTLGLL